MQQLRSINHARKKAVFFGEPEPTEQVFAQGRYEKIAALTDLYPHIVDLSNFNEHADRLREVEVGFSTWGMPILTAAHLDKFPSLRAVFFAAGSVKFFAHPLLERGITVVSAWQANAIPVAEFTLSQILLSTKGYFRNTHAYHSQRNGRRAFRGHGNLGETVAILGTGAIGKKLIEFLRPFHLHVIVFDPFLSETSAAKLGVEKVSLEEAFQRGYVVSNHIANLPETEGMLHGELFALMRENATFINTGRGITVKEEGMIKVLQARPDITALLDVTWPESPAEDSPLFSLPNVQLTTHIAGSLNDETVRMADFCIEEFKAWECGQPLRYAVSMQMLEMMA